MNIKSFTTKLTWKLMGFLIMASPGIAFADEVDPATMAAIEMHKILFGILGTSLVGIIIGATFLMAKTGKVSWDKLMFIGCCAAGFLGAPLIVTMIRGWVTG